MIGAITLNHYLWVSGLLFALGIAGVIVRRNLLVMFMALEMNLNAANLALIAFAKFNKLADGQVLVFFITPLRTRPSRRLRRRYIIINYAITRAR